MQKLPDLPELTEMAKKFFGDMRKSVEEIVHDYKAKHPFEEKEEIKVPPKDNPGLEDSETAAKADEEIKKSKSPKN